MNPDKPLFEALLLLGKILGMSRSVATVFALLYSNESPITIEEIAEQGNLSKSAVSLALRDLIQMGAAQEVAILGERCRHYNGQPDLALTVQHMIVERAQNPLSLLRAKLENAAGTQSRLQQARELIKTLDHILVSMQG